jgi:AraC family transcriptional regulator
MQSSETTGADGKVGLSSLWVRSPAETSQWVHCEARMRRVIGHVYDHLDEPLDLFVLADVACLSPHHWHRVYHAMLGETLAQTVKRLRLHRAAGQLANSATPVAQVAVMAGYPDVQSFTRIFKSVYGLPPASYRSNGQHREFDVTSASPAGPGFDVAVRTLDELPVLAVEHRGSYMDIGRAFDLLFTGASAAGVVRPGVRMLGLFFDDPELVPEDALRAQAALAGCAEPVTARGAQPLRRDDQLVDETGPTCGPVTVGTDLPRTAIPSGSYAVLTHIGPYASMKSAYRWLFGEWLPRSGFDPADGPVVEEYLNSPRDTAPADLRTLICVPVRPRQDPRPAS